jgi:hypothetical protein
MASSRAYVKLNTSDNGTQLELSHPFVMATVARKGSGKTHLTAEYFLREMSIIFPIIWLISPLKDAPIEYYMIPSDFIKDDFNKDVLAEIVEYSEERGNLPTLIIIEDSTGKSWLESPEFYALVSNHRHHNFSISVNIQYINKQIPQLVKSNTDYAIWFRTYGKNFMNGLYETWGSAFIADKKVFAHIVHNLPKHEAMFADLRTPHLYHIKAPKDVPPFVLTWTLDPKRTRDLKKNEDEVDKREQEPTAENDARDTIMQSRLFNQVLERKLGVPMPPNPKYDGLRVRRRYADEPARPLDAMGLNPQEHLAVRKTNKAAERVIPEMAQHMED